MPMNVIYKGSADLPEIIPVFPLPGALLLPRGQMPLNIFEPRYLEMVDDAIASRHRLIGMIQPDLTRSDDETQPQLYRVGCVGRITQLAETGDGRYLLQLTGVARFRIEEELEVATAYRQCRVSYVPFADDFIARRGEEHVNRQALLEALAAFLKANNLKTDWEGIENAPNEALVNALAMMSPYGAAEKQALLEAKDLKSRAEILVALTDFLKANDLKADWEGIENAPNEALVNALAMMSPYGSAEKQAMLEAPDLKTRAEILVAVTQIELAKSNTQGETPVQ